MSALPKPPRRATPEAFCTTYLPQLWTALVGDAPLPAQQAEVVWHVHVGQEAFALRVAQGRFHAERAAGGEALVALHCDLEAFRMGVQVFARALEQAEKHAGQARAVASLVLPQWNAGKAQVLQSNPGSVVFAYTDDAGDTGTLTLRVAGGKGPAVTVHVGDSDVDTLLNSPGAAQRLLGSRIRMEGDTAYLMRLVQQLPNG